MQDIYKEYKRWLDNADNSLNKELIDMTEDDINECFGDSLSFGTAGLRGFLRAGTNGMNVHSVARATQGLANYLNKNFDKPSVAIARDSRNMGEQFVKICVSVLVANGVVAKFHDRVESTPGLSFSVRNLKCSAGICVTASHNPAEYNGYKVYGPDGCQITTEAANAISAEISKLDYFDDVNILDFIEACKSGYGQVIPHSVREAFVASACACSVVPTKEENKEAYEDAVTNASNLNIVYTPLNGTGYDEVTEALNCCNFSQIHVVAEQKEPNGNFPSCPYPNPELTETLSLGIDYCHKYSSDLLIATDPDADRVGVAVKHGDGYVRLNGNEIGVLLFNYLCEARKLRGDKLEDLVCVTTIVSSDLVNALADYYSVELRRTLTGFKYIGEQILHLENAHEVDRFMFGFEESCGYLAGSHVRDKDGISACLLICQMAAMYKAKNLDLIDVLNGLYEKFGYFLNDQVSKEYPGVEGKAQMDKVLKDLRDNQPKKIAGLKVISCTDYNTKTYMYVSGDSINKPQELLPKSNVLEFELEGGSKIIVRPSGTEPKIKVYCFSYAKTYNACNDLMVSLKSSAKLDLL